MQQSPSMSMMVGPLFERARHNNSQSPPGNYFPEDNLYTSLHHTTVNDGTTRKRPKNASASSTQKRLKTARRREQCRINQARYRFKQDRKGDLLNETVYKLKEEIPLLEMQRDRILFGAKQSVFNVVVEYMSLFRHGVWSLHQPLRRGACSRRYAQNAEAQQQLVFLRSSFASDVSVGDRYGVDALVEQWQRYSEYFGDLHFQLEQLQEPVKNLVVASASLTVTVTESTLKNVLVHQEDSELSHKLLGRRMLLPCSLLFEWDEVTSHVTRLEMTVDFFTPICRVLGSLKDAAFVLSRALITRDCVRARQYQMIEDFHKSTGRTAFAVGGSRHFDRSVCSTTQRSNPYSQIESKQRSPEPEFVDPGNFQALFNDSGEHPLQSDHQIKPHGAENPRKSDRRREQCRVNQARYRHRQHQKEKQFSESISELRDKIPLLELQRSRLICGVKLSVSDVVVEYFHLFRYGVSVNHFTLNTKTQKSIIQCPQTQQQLVFLRSSMAQDVDLGDRCGLEALMDVWRQYSSCFEDIYFQLEQMEEIVKNVVVVSASLSLTVTEVTLKFVFPELVGRKLGDRLLGRRLKLPCSIWFQWDAAAGLVTGLEASLDFLLPLSEVLSSLSDAAFVLSNSQIRHGGVIEEFDTRRRQYKKNSTGRGPISLGARQNNRSVGNFSRIHDSTA
ncbi:bZIP transcription factor 1 [Phytophthora citrophthora]|uniref:BZIP transcription factor 1 n=1 Tax=Phytophthora citrophthora TaxID=4793 RepID=A0AAD9LIR7_9STRA|nr:bZIP transcription factor 1 [Phytophthora citrophthora]